MFTLVPKFRALCSFSSRRTSTLSYKFRLPQSPGLSFVAQDWSGAQTWHR